MFKLIKDSKWPILLIAAFASIYLIVVSYYVPLFADDLCRARLDFSFVKAIKLAVGEYLGWSGRLPVMFLNHMFFSGDGTPTMIFNILNGIILFALLLYISAKSNVTDALGQVVYLTIFIGLFWFIPTTLGEVLFWKTGAVQYFWGSALTISAILPMLMWYWFDQAPSANKPIIVFYVIGCFLGGFWLEHVSAAVLAFWALLLIICRFQNNRKVPIQFLFGFYSWAIGTVLLIIAPGNYTRIEVVGKKMALVEKITRTTELMPSHTYPTLLYVGLAFLLIMVIYPSPKSKRQIGLSISFIMLGLLCGYAMVGAPVLVFHGRGAFMTEMFFILSVMALFPANVFEIRSSPKYASIALVLLSVVISVMLLKDNRHILHVYKSLAKQEQNRQVLIAEAKKNGQVKIVLPRLFLTDRINTKGIEINFGRYFARDITIRPSSQNSCYARYYGMKKVSQ